jgi:UrcA family protein
MSVLLMALAGGALAPAGDVPTLATDRIDVIRRVKTGDLDLASPAGRLLLDKRIGSAVRALCPRDTRTGLVSGHRARNSCLEAAMNNAMGGRDRLLASRGITPEYRTASRTPE